MPVFIWIWWWRKIKTTHFISEPTQHQIENRFYLNWSVINQNKNKQLYFSFTLGTYEFCFDNLGNNIKLEAYIAVYEPFNPRRKIQERLEEDLKAKATNESLVSLERIGVSNKQYILISQSHFI